LRCNRQTISFFLCYNAQQQQQEEEKRLKIRRWWWRGAVAALHRKGLVKPVAKNKY
jgi:hypothetical protein